MLVLGREDVDSIVDPGGLVEDIRKIYLSEHIALERIPFTFGDTWVGVMRGFHKDLGLVIKIVGIYPRSTPSVKGIVIVIDHVGGDVRAIIDGYSLTGWRTACASALAHELMGGRKIEVLGVIGSGTQAYYHLRVFTRLFRIERIVINSRSVEKASRLARDFGADTIDLDNLNRISTTIIAATNSQDPVVKGSLLAPSTIVISVGAPKPVREIDDTTARRASCALVDTEKGVIEESDDAKGIELVELGEALRGRTCSFGDIKLYKSVGTSTLDIAGAYHILRRRGLIKAP
jgi:alanine dehydrogenase